jgi:hypothetical protein
MALNWKTVTAEHIREACKKVAASRTGKRASRIVVQYEGQTLPAKEVQRTAYLIANHLPENTELKFSSGDSTLNLLSGLGFKVERLETLSGHLKNSGGESVG